MNRFSRILQLSLIIILLISIFALASMIYAQYQSQQCLESKYEAIVEQNIRQQPFAQEAVSVTLQLSRYINATDVDRTIFTDRSHHRILPLVINLYSDWGVVTFWFDERELDNWQLLLHLPSWEQDIYITIYVPFFDYQQSLGD